MSREYHGNEVWGGLTSGEAGPLVAASELYIEVCDQGMDVVVPLDLQTEWRSEGQVVYLHCVDVHLLWNKPISKLHNFKLMIREMFISFCPSSRAVRFAFIDVACLGYSTHLDETRAAD